MRTALLVLLAAWYLLPGVVLHCLFALWMFGQPGVFPSDSLIGDADAQLAALGFRPQAVAQALAALEGRAMGAAQRCMRHH